MIGTTILIAPVIAAGAAGALSGLAMFANGCTRAVGHLLNRRLKAAVGEVAGGIVAPFAVAGATLSAFAREAGDVASHAVIRAASLVSKRARRYDDACFEDAADRLGEMLSSNPAAPAAPSQFERCRADYNDCITAQRDVRATPTADVPPVPAAAGA